MTQRLNAFQTAPEAYKAMLGLQEYVNQSKLEHSLQELVNSLNALGVGPRLVGEGLGRAAPLDEDAVGIVGVDRHAEAVVDLGHVVAVRQPPVARGRDVFEAGGQVVGPESAGQCRADGAVQRAGGGVDVLATDEAAGEPLQRVGLFVRAPRSGEETDALRAVVLDDGGKLGRSGVDGGLRGGLRRRRFSA